MVSPYAVRSKPTAQAPRCTRLKTIGTPYWHVQLIHLPEYEDRTNNRKVKIQ